MSIELEPLYRAVFAAPGDDGPRLVLADALQEQGDPRGEFISLQLQPRLSQRSERRMAKLLERHGGQFLRRLAPLVMPSTEQRWSRGFLSSASVVLEGLHADVEDLATLERLEVLFSPAAPLELASPHMRSLKDVAMAALSAAPVLFDAPRPLAVEHVGLSGPGNLEAWPAELTRLIGEARTLPKLERLTLRCSRANFEDVAWVWQMPVLRRLRSLTFDGSFRGLQLQNMLSVLRQLEAAPASVVFDGAGLTLRGRAGDGFRSLQVEVEPRSAVIFAAMLDTLVPDALDDSEVTSAHRLEPAAVGALRGSAKRLRLTNLGLPSTQSRMK